MARRCETKKNGISLVEFYADTQIHEGQIMDEWFINNMALTAIIVMVVGFTTGYLVF